MFYRSLDAFELVFSFSLAAQIAVSITCSLNKAASARLVSRKSRQNVRHKVFDANAHCIPRTKSYYACATLVHRSGRMQGTVIES